MNKVTYVDGQTVITAANLNNIQDAINTLETNVSNKQSKLTAGSGISISGNTISVNLSTWSGGSY